MNIAKIIVVVGVSGAGRALNDDDRQPWLENINEALLKAKQSRGAVLACSALKESYRKILSNDLESSLSWVILKGDFELIKKRMEQRDHFMPADLLKSQFETWEEPDYGIKVDVVEKPETIVSEIIKNMSMNVKAEIGLIGLGVMGKSLSRNIVMLMA